MGTPLSSDFLRKRGTCCGSNCLHCPYGTTLKNLGVVFIPSLQFDHLVLENLKSSLLPSSVTSNLLADAFGTKVKTNDAELFVLTLKEIPCGLAYIEGAKLKEFFLLPAFDDQGITAAYLEARLPSPKEI